MSSVSRCDCRGRTTGYVRESDIVGYLTDGVWPNPYTTRVYRAYVRYISTGIPLQLLNDGTRAAKSTPGQTANCRARTAHTFLEPVNLYFGQSLVEFDYPIESVYFLETAVTSTVVHMPHGETLEVGIMGAEGFVGLSLLYGIRRSNGTVVVQVPGTAWRMKSSDFLQHVKAQGGPCLDLLFRYANFFQVMVQQHAACNATHQIEERMCRWILLTHDRTSTDGFPLTQEYLSLMLGARRATVSTIAHRLKEAGIVSYTRGKLVVSDRKRLEECACDCYRLIKEQTDRTFEEDWATARL